MKVKLYEYQKKGLAFALKHRYCIIGDEQGLGKTIQAIALIEKSVGLSLVICPGMLRFNWKQEIEKFTDLTVQAIMNAKDTVDYSSDVLVTSYETAPKVFAKELKPTCIVVDECQYIKNMKSKRTVFLHNLVYQSKPKYFLGLSGTPIKNHAGEFFSILKLCSYSPTTGNGLRVEERSQYSFSSRFCWEENNGFGTVFYGVKNISDLKKYLKGKYIRRTSKQVLDLPPLRNKTINLDLKNFEVSDKALIEAYQEYKALGKHGSHISQLKHDSALKKVPYTLEYTYNMLSEGESIVVFTDHIGSLKALLNGYKKKGYKVGYICGGLKDEDKHRQVEEFQSGQIRVLVCTFGSAATGFTLTKAKNLIMNDITWVPADLEQARKRIHRIGQGKSCLIHYIVSGKLDEKLTHTVLTKSQTLRKIL